VGARVVTGARLARLCALAAGAALVALLAGWLGAERWYRTPRVASGIATVVEIPPGSRLAAVASLLAARGVIDYPRLWTLLVRRHGQGARLRAGEYQIEAGASPEAIVEQLVAGRVLLHPVTLIEGWTCAAALAALAGNPLLTPTLPAGGEGVLMARLGAARASCEGELFPDTYLVARGTSDLDVLALAHARLEQRLAANWQSRRADLPLATPYQALILASVIEKETGTPDERPRIAAVFVNRLRRGMRLQTDPTVIYGLGAAYSGTLHGRDLVTDTPYNTYTRDGLPPTPIALPGEASLHAAVQPADSDELYFVATGLGDGRHQFSRTLAEHNVAVARYLARLRAAPSRGTDQ
jgi:UPF0755 protein